MFRHNENGSTWSTSKVRPSAPPVHTLLGRQDRIDPPGIFDIQLPDRDAQEPVDHFAWGG